MSRLIALAVMVALLPAPALAGPPTKRPICQIQKAPSRDAKRIEPCRKSPAIPWVVDPTPFFLLSTGPSSAFVAEIS